MYSQLLPSTCYILLATSYTLLACARVAAEGDDGNDEAEEVAIVAPPDALAHPWAATWHAERSG